MIERAVPGDAAAILALQKLTYQSEARLYNDFDLPPLRQTLEEMRADLATQLCLKALAGGVIIGSVRGVLRGETCLIGRLIVHPEHQRRGLGSRLLGEIEARFPRAARFELFTGHMSEGNLRLYGRLGYREFARKPVHEGLELVYLEKVRGAE